MLKYARLTCVLALGAAALSAQVAPAPNVVRTSGMVGIAESQTAQLNVLNPGIAPPAATGMICVVAVSFIDAGGTVLKSTTLSVAPGKSQSFDLHSDSDLQIVSGGRREIRATLSQPVAVPATATSAAAPACKVQPTLEIFDSVSGRTLVTLGHFAAVPPGPSTNP